MTLNERIELLAQLGDYLLETPDDELSIVIRQSYNENKWFTEANQLASLNAIATQFLNKEKLENWVKLYSIHTHDYPTKTIGIVMAGNIPLVGFYDWLCVFIAGQKAAVKLSEKDKKLFPFLIKKLAEFNFQIWNHIEFVERLNDFDAVIATGSNNTSRYFEQYFSAKPHIIRKNRTSVAIINGTETADDFLKLGHDILDYFGLGCRNVSKLFVPKNYDFNLFLETTHNHFNEMANHDKWRNNFDYNITLFQLNNIVYWNNGCLILREEKSLQSRISCIHFEEYENAIDLQEKLSQISDEVQCFVSKNSINGFSTLPFGTTQKPTLFDAPDGVDVLQFLTSIN